MDPDPRVGIARTLNDTSKIQGKPKIRNFLHHFHLLGCRKDPFLSDDLIFPFPGAWVRRIRFWSSPYLDGESRKEASLTSGAQHEVTDRS